MLEELVLKIEHFFYQTIFRFMLLLNIRIHMHNTIIRIHPIMRIEF